MKIVLASVFAIASLFIADSSKADNTSAYETDFNFVMTIGAHTEKLNPTPRITLPAGFSNWNCWITDKYRSDDGAAVYHNIACTNLIDGTVLGSTIQCKVDKESQDVEAFFMRTRTVNLMFAGGCQTHKRGAPLQKFGTVNETSL